MIKKRELRAEILRYPDFIREAVRQQNYVLARELEIELDTLIFVLEV